MELHLLRSDSDLSAPQRGRISGAALCSIAVHVAALAVLVWVTYSRISDTGRTEPEATLTRVVWVAMPGPSGGGGGSKATTPPPPTLTPPPAARRWRFRPGTRAGEAVPVLVNLEIEFNIR